MKKKHILWADDDTDDLMLMRHVLQDIGEHYHITEVNNGQEAIEFLQKAKHDDNLPALVILDMNMPVMNGKETLNLIRQDDVLKAIPLVFFTTSNSELDKLYCKRFNVEMVTKPPRYSSLKETVGKLLNSYLNKP